MDQVNPRAPAALVTGGAVRVGRAIVEELAAAGFDVAIHYHGSQEAADELVERLAEGGRRAVRIRGDFTRPGVAGEIVERAVGELGQLDLLVNNAGLLMADDAPLQDLARMKLLNVDAPRRCLEAAVPHLAARGGSVVNIADVAAMAPFGRYRAYSRGKHALLELTRSSALEHAAKGVRVNAVCPGTVLFPDDYPPADRAAVVAGVPLGRIGDPRQVAQGVLYLARAQYVTGHALVVDGGRLLVAQEGRTLH